MKTIQTSLPSVIDFVIVLCPNIGYRLDYFEEYADDGLYIGGPTRMQAAVDLYHDPDVTIRQFIVVGGGLNEATPELRWHKTENMQRFLVQNGVPEEIITCISSDSDTRGNLRAVWVTCRERLRGKTVGVLTNQYHIDRTMLIVTDLQFDWGNTRFIALPAETWATSAVNLPALDSPALLGRVKRERQGVQDWQNGVYTGQHTPVEEWRGQIRRQ